LLASSIQNLACPEDTKIITQIFVYKINFINEELIIIYTYERGCGFDTVFAKLREHHYVKF
jgi:hypothetical protein